MRRAYRGQEVIYNDNGYFYGINLGADFTAEHEWGIEKLEQRFGINRTLMGVDGRTITQIPNTFVYGEITIEKSKYIYLVCDYDVFETSKEKLTKKDLSGCQLVPYSKETDIYTSWDSKSFGILVSEKYKDEIELLYNAFINRDILIGVSPSGVFENGGLKFLIKSSLGKDIIKSMMDTDMDYINLQKKAEKTGIYEILKRAGKEYYALSPKWKDDKKSEVIFFLNPKEQNIYDCGWFTVNDLKEWAKDKGKIIITKLS